jgi:hypothetical protein
LNPKNVSLVLFACILGLCLMVSLPLHAQVTGATVSGTITDASGAVIAGAEVSVRNIDTGIIRNTTADSAGFYTVPNLIPGPYEVKVTAKGFTTAVQSNLTLAVGAQQSLNIPMKVGETSQTVQVTEAAPQIELTSSTISGQVEAATMRELPLNGRDWTSLATLTPGVNVVSTQLPFESGALRGNRGFGTELTISGGRPTQNNYRLDGLSINDWANGGPGSVIGGTLGVDAIQEFSVVTANYSAEYGRTSGGIVNAISKSGTNAFHGDIYGFIRSQKWDANDFFNNANNKPKPPYKRNQFGGAAGGPIRKGRTFIFGDYEGIRQTQGATVVSFVPSDDARLGILNPITASNPTGKSVPAANTGAGTSCTNPAPSLPGGTTPGHYLRASSTVCMDDKVTAAADRVAPVPGFPFGYLDIFPHGDSPNVDKATFVNTAARVVSENYFTLRVDHKISDKDSLFGTYMYDKNPFNQTDLFANTGVLSQSARQLAALEWTHAFSPSLINTARLGFNRNTVLNFFNNKVINPAAGDQSLGSFPGGYSPNLFISGFGRPGPGLNGVGTPFAWNSYQFYDDAFLTRGSHSLKFGFAMERMQFTYTTVYNPWGIWRGNLEKFLTNQLTSLEGGGLLGRGNPHYFRQTLFGGYIQDDWRMRRNLTLNLGLRYEMTTVVNEIHGHVTNVRNITDPLPFCGTTDLAQTNILGQAGCAGTAPYYSNPTTLNFEPRIGFAWDPRGDGKTSVRGGFALFDILPLPGYNFSQQGIVMPFYLTGVSNTPVAGLLGVPASDPGSAYNNILAPSSTCTTPSGVCTLTGGVMEPNPKRSYVEQWNITVQRQITPSLTATVGYLGSHGVHLLQRGDDADMVIPCPPKCSPGETPPAPGRYLWPANSTRNDRINPNFGGLRYLFWGTDSSYRALQMNVQKSMSHGLQFGGSYTYSKAMDTNSATMTGDAFANSLTHTFWFAPQTSLGPSDFNYTHSAAINGIWQVPGPRAGFAQVVFGGWELGSILKLSSGAPTTLVIQDDPMGVQNFGSDTYGIPDRVPGCDPVNHNYKNTKNLSYINTSCFTLPKATPDIASECVPFVGNGTLANPQFPGTCSNLLGNSGRNSVTGPRFVNLDSSVYKNFAVKKISESASVQFRAEFFNIMNHPNFQPPLSFAHSGTSALFQQDGTPTNAGNLNATVTSPSGRDIQFALKLIW